MPDNTATTTANNERALKITSAVFNTAGLVRPGQVPTSIDTFWYNIEFDGLGTGNPAMSGTIQTQSDSDFVLCNMSAAYAFGGSAAPEISPATDRVFIQITDTSDGKTFWNAPVFMGMAFGYTGFPYILPAPRIWKPNINIKIDLTGANNFGPTRLSLSFGGVRIFYG